METRIAVLGIVVEDFNQTAEINEILHENRQYVVGRLGIPYAKKDVAVISLVLDAPQDVVSAISGKIGMLAGVQCKAVYSTK